MKSFNLFKRDDYHTVLLFNCSVTNSELHCELGYWHHPQEGFTELKSESGVLQVLGPQDPQRQNIVHINPVYDLEVF